MNAIPDSEDQSSEDNAIQLKSHSERKLKRSLDKLETDLEFISRYEKMEPKSRLQGLELRLMRWRNNDFQSERQRLETNKYLCSRLVLVSAPVFILSIVPPVNSGLTLLSGLTTAFSLFGYGMFVEGLEELEDQEGCDCE